MSQFLRNRVNYSLILLQSDLHGFFPSYSNVPLFDEARSELPRKAWLYFRQIHFSDEKIEPHFLRMNLHTPKFMTHKWRANITTQVSLTLKTVLSVFQETVNRWPVFSIVVVQSLSCV